MLLPKKSCHLVLQVDIFSLGVSLYELMTLRELPPEGIHPASFDTELEQGRRPQFISVVSLFVYLRELTWMDFLLFVVGPKVSTAAQ